MSLSDELLSLSSVEMRRRIGTKEVSPVELVEASIARIEALNPTINAIAATDFAHARKLAISAESAARKGEQLGPLHGLPTGIKDLHETAGLLTTYGSPLYRNHVPPHDAAMVALVREAGAIILCKNNVPEFGAGANTRNLVWGANGDPFDPWLNAGGSSGGSFFFSSRRRHTRWNCDWSSEVCSSDLSPTRQRGILLLHPSLARRANGAAGRSGS